MKVIVISTIRHTAKLPLHYSKAHCTLPAVHPMNWDRAISSMFFSLLSFRGLAAKPVLAGHLSKMNSTIDLPFTCKATCPVGKDRFLFAQQRTRGLNLPPETPLQCHKRHQDGYATSSEVDGEERFARVPTSWGKYSEG